MLKRLLLILLFAGATFCVNAQVIYEPGTPVGLTGKVDVKALPDITTQRFDPTSLGPKGNCPGCKVMPIGKVFRYNVDFKKTARMIKSGDENIWYLRVTSPQGQAISLTFSKLSMRPGDKLYIYAADGSFSFGPITYRNNKPGGLLPTRYFPARDLVIEFHEQAGTQEDNDFFVKDIIVYTKRLGDSQACEVNISCPEGAQWQTEKKAVAKIVFTSGHSQYLCTGALVANTSADREPYFLTANHCISNNNEAQSAVFYFNYESTDCAGQNVLQGQTISGSALIATGSRGSTDHLDFTLLRLSVMPPYNYAPYFAGWSRVSDPTAIDSSVCIHHPSGDIKKISKDLNNPGVGSFSGYDANTHWHILAWDIGTTEGGSSGSPLFNPNKRIIGDLTGGEASCDNNVNDYFAQFYQSWDKYADSTMQLKHWLDPLGQNPTYFDGYDPYENYVYVPPVGKIYGYATGDGAKIHWLPPDYAGDSLIYDDFDSYREFSLSLPVWTQVDRDKGVTWGIEGVQFENENYIGSFIVFNSKQTDPADPIGWSAHSGDQMLVCFSSQPPDNPNDDWLISQRFTCTANHKFAFYARSVTDSFGLERIRVLVSEGSSAPTDFVPVSSEPYVKVPVQWTRFVYDLSQYAGKQIYVAINVVSDNSFALLLDDMSITNAPDSSLKQAIVSNKATAARQKLMLVKSMLPHYKAPVLQGYKVFRNYKKIAVVDSTKLYYVDHTSLPAKYYVVAIYDTGDAAASPEIEVTEYSDSLSAYDRDNAVQILPNPVTDGHFRVVLNHPVKGGKLSLYNVCGQKIFSQDFNNTKEKEFSLSFLQSGVYVMELKVQGESYKTLFIVL